LDLTQEVKEIVRRCYSQRFEGRTFRPGVDWVPVSGKAFGPEELEALVQCALEFWLTAGPYCHRFESRLRSIVGAKAVALTNSGSSANLLAVSALCSLSLGERRLRGGDEIITAALGFPTTLNPILQNHLSAVLIDSRLGTYNPDVSHIEAALSPRTRGVFLAHSLGNPFQVDVVSELCRKRGLFLIEDACDALGASFVVKTPLVPRDPASPIGRIGSIDQTTLEGKPLGSWGDLSTLSFYPAHHITTGEGGAVLSQSDELARIVRSLRDWGRHCWCEPGHDNTCGHRYDALFPGLPVGYDHKYVYSEIGYNLKMTDLQAAIGEAQLERLPLFAQIRDRNFLALHELFRSYEEWFILPRPVPGAKPSWFGYPLTVREQAPFSRLDFIRYLDSRRIGTRLMFGGNLARQPAYLGNPLVKTPPAGLPGADEALTSSFWLGVCQAIDEPRLSYMLECIEGYLHAWQARRPARGCSLPRGNDLQTEDVL
jgi:CDP-6-deoxy-D-xylo-4-hexulose-3-dehydrase